MKIVAETWGLCDFRRVGPTAKQPAEPCIGFWGKEVYPGVWADAGDWFSLQDGMVSGPYKSKQLAKKALRENRKADLSDDKGTVGQLSKVLARYKGCRVTLAEFEV